MDASAERNPDQDHNLPFVAWYRTMESLQEPGQDLRSGDPCPQCRIGRIDYDGMLNLTCNHCSYTLSGGSGCT